MGNIESEIGRSLRFYESASPNKCLFIVRNALRVKVSGYFPFIDDTPTGRSESVFGMALLSDQSVQ